MRRTSTALVAVLLLGAAPAGSRPLPFHYDLYTFRGDEGATRVVATFAVSAGRLVEKRMDGELRYRFDVSLVLADTMTGTVSRTDDSVYVGALSSLPREHLLYTQVDVDVPPSAHTVHRVVMTDASTPGVGQLHDGPYPVPSYGGDSLMLSDIALGEPGVEGGWERGDLRLAIFPTSQFPQGSFDVYYEVYNLPMGHPYDTEISVQEVDVTGRPADRDPARTRFTGKALSGPDDVLPELRHVAAELPHGRYRITVTVTDRITGESTGRSRLFRVRGWRPGTSLLMARPRADRPGG